jgi:hypothetical protein
MHGPFLAGSQNDPVMIDTAAGAVVRRREIRHSSFNDHTNPWFAPDVVSDWPITCHWSFIATITACDSPSVHITKPCYPASVVSADRVHRGRMGPAGHFSVIVEAPGRGVRNALVNALTHVFYSALTTPDEEVAPVRVRILQSPRHLTQGIHAEGSSGRQSESERKSEIDGAILLGPHHRAHVSSRARASARPPKLSQ